MNAYSAYDKFDAGAEGAMLVFAKTARQARKISYGYDWCNSEYTDWVATRIHNLPTHLKALDNGKEQVFSNPPSCNCCGHWGYELIDFGCARCINDKISEEKENNEQPN